jgi:poly(3-hydroxybutyrate) depolymerase
MLLVLLCTVSSLHLAAQSIIGRQKVDQYPISSSGNTTYGLTWLPADYTTTTKRYPLIIFLHGTGESGSGIGGLYNLITTALPQKIAQGFDPAAVNPQDGKLYQFIVVSPQAPSWSYSFSSIQYMLPDIISRYRVDEARIYISGVSAGGAGTWSCVTNGPSFATKLAAVVPVSAAGTNSPAEQNELQYIGGTYGVKAWSVCGMEDAFWGPAQNFTTIINNGIPAPSVPAVASGIPGAGHTSAAWNTAYDSSWRSNSFGLNVFEWMLRYSRTAPQTSPSIAAGSDQTITLPVNNLVLSGNASAQPGTSLNVTAWSRYSGPDAGTIASPTSASTTVSGLIQGTYVFRMIGKDNNGGVGTDDVTVKVNPSTAYVPIPSRIEAEHWVVSNGIQTETTADAGGGLNVGYIDNGDWMEYNVKVPSDGNYTLNFRVASAFSGGMIQVKKSDGTVLGTLNVPQTGGFQTWQTAGLVVPLLTGNESIRITSTSNTSWNFNWLEFINPNVNFNVAPVANAGSNTTITLPLNSAALNGSGTDADGSITGYNWTKISGPSQYSLVNAVYAQATATNLVSGVYQFELTVTDNAGASGKDTVEITVNPAPNVAPLVEAGPNQAITLPVSTTTLNGAATDADGSIVSYQWTKISGPSSYSITAPSQATTEIRGLVEGTYQFELKAVDNNGATGKDTVSITVSPAPNMPPAANAGSDQSITLPVNSVTLNGSGTDADGTIASYSWKKLSGPSSLIIVNASAALTGVNNLVEGRYEFELTVTDNNGAAGKDTVFVTVQQAVGIPNIAPTANAGADQTIMLPINTVALAGTGTDPDGTIAAYQWTKISGPAQATIATPTQFQTQVSNLVHGVYQFQLTVTDDDGAKGSDTVQVTVNAVPNVLPLANAGPDQTVRIPNNSVTLNGTASDADGNIISTRWTQLNGAAATITTPTSLTTTVTGLSAGTYLFRLTVMDDDSATAIDDIQIQVTSCGGVRRVVTPWPDGGMFYSGKPTGLNYTVINPGDTIVLRATNNTWSYFAMEDIHGTPSCPIVIINEGGQVRMTKGFDLKHCTNIKVSGSGSSDAYGFYVYNPASNDNAGVALSLQGRSKNVEFEKVSVRKKTYGAWFKQDPLCADSVNYPNWQMDNIKIHDCKFLNIGQDCIYAGNTNPTGTHTLNCNGKTINPLPMRLSNIQIYNLIIDSCMRTGIQLSGADSGYNSIHDNIVTRCGYERNQFQGTGISIGGMTKNCHVYNNTIRNTFLYGILDLGAGTNYIENNIIDSSGYLNGEPNMVTQPNNIFVDTRPTIPFDSARAIVRNNKVGKNAGLRNQDIYFNMTHPTYATGNLICGNTKLDGTTPATFYVYPGVQWDDCIADTGNLAPIANAGNDQVISLPTTTATLYGSAMDPELAVWVTTWKKLSGPSQITYLSSNQPQIDIANLVAGTYVFEFRVEDRLGAADLDTCIVVVNSGPPNILPVANAGSNITITLPVSNAVLNGSGTDANGSIVSYQWNKISGPSQYVIGAPNSSSTSVSSLVQGLYNFELTVTDNHGGTGKDTVQVTVNPAPPPANIAPVANAGPDVTITLPTNSAPLNGSATDADGQIVSHTWNRISGPSQYNIFNAVYAQATATNLVQGTYYFELRVTDNAGATGTDTMKLTVNPVPPPANLPPVANAGSDIIITLPVNNTVLNGTASDADGSISSYNWTKISGPPQYSIAAPNSAQTGLNSLVQGVYQMELRVTDNGGAIDLDTVQVTVNPAPPPANIPPDANAGADVTITLPVNNVSLAGSATDSDGWILSYSWTKISGPSSFNIASPGSAQTSITNLVQGVYSFSLAATDNVGAQDRDTVVVTVLAAPPPPNVLPQANAGADQSITLPVNSVTLSGSGTDTDGTIVSYGWTKISGPAPGNISNSAAAQTTVTGMVQGIYLFRLTVTDNSGATGTDTMKVTVHPAPNVVPVASAGPDISITLPVNSTLLNGSGTDADGSIVSYAWTKLSGPAATISNAAAAQTTVSGLVQGTYHFVLTVTDNNGATGKDTLLLTVHAAPPPPNVAPTANAGADITITLPVNSTTLTGSGSDVDGTIAGYAWTKVTGPAASIITSASAQTSVSGLVQGVYQFMLTVTDNNGATGKDTVMVTVLAAPPPPNVLPTANAGADISITLPVNTAALSGTGTDPDGTITGYLWTKISGPAAFSITQPNAAQSNVTGLVQGMYGFQLRVTDNSGAYAFDTVMITVSPALNIAPDADAGFDQSITLPVTTTQLNGSAKDSDGSVVSVRWTKTSGPSSFTFTNVASAQTTVSNLVQGLYQFVLTATDDDGATGSDTVIITVYAAPPPPNKAPTANAGTDIVITLPVNTTPLNGSGADSDGNIVAYQWTRISGPASYSLVNATNAQASLANLVQGVYSFQLSVTDNHGATGKDTVQVTVQPQPDNLLPVAVAGADQVITLPTNHVTLNGSATDADGTIAAYQWTKISGPAQCSITSPAHAGTTVSNLTEGVYRFELWVTDNRGGSGRDTVTVTVNPYPNMPPVADAGTDQVIILPTNHVTLTGRGTDADGTITGYRWKKVAGPSGFAMSSFVSAATIASGLAEGLYEFELTVTDNRGATASDTVIVIVKNLPSSKASAYPNPADDYVDVKIEANTQANVTALNIYDGNGKVVYSETFMRSSNVMIRRVHVAHFAKGVYLIEVSADINTKVTCKLIKQ